MLDPGEEAPQENHRPVDSWEQLYLAQLSFIDRAAAVACRRYGLRPQDSEEFAQHVKLKILDDDYAVLRKFKQTSALETYLGMVVANACKDYVNHLWGKWRTSPEARRLGPLAVILERLLTRDQLTLGEACQTLWTDYRVTATESELHDLAGRLPQRFGRPTESSGDAALAAAAGEGPAPERGNLPRWISREPADARVRFAELARLREKARQALRAALQTLDDEDRLIARLLPERSIADIARDLHMEQKPLYPRVKKILGKLREVMERAGIRPDDVTEILDDDDG